MVQKNKKDSDITKKETKMSKTFLNNLKSLKKMADKEGISLGELVKMIKKDE